MERFDDIRGCLIVVDFGLEPLDLGLHLLILGQLILNGLLLEGCLILVGLDLGLCSASLIVNF